MSAHFGVGQREWKSPYTYGRLGDHSARIPGLSEPSESVAHDASQVFRALAEGLQMALAAM